MTRIRDMTVSLYRLEQCMEIFHNEFLARLGLGHKLCYFRHEGLSENKMKLITAQEARQLGDMAREWKKGNLIDILDKTMQDIKGATMAGKSAITMESISPNVSLTAFVSELVALGYEVIVLEPPFPPRCVNISWKD